MKEECVQNFYFFYFFLTVFTEIATATLIINNNAIFKELWSDLVQCDTSRYAFFISKLKKIDKTKFLSLAL